MKATGRLWLIRQLLFLADATICRLPTPQEPRGPYFQLWGDLGNVHGAIDDAYPPRP